MEWLNNLLFPRQHKFTRFVYTIMIGSLPVIFRLFAASSGKLAWFDYKDVLYTGVALNLSNFTLTGSRPLPYKEQIIGWSIICSIVNSVAIMVFLLTAGNMNGTGWILYFLSGIFVFLSVYVSFFANEIVFQNKT